MRGEPFTHGTTISRHDRAVLKSLAQHVAELAHRPIEQAKRDLWLCLSSLEETQPVIFCDPDYGWNEIITESDLRCEGMLARSWEYRLRKEAWWGDCMKDDHVIEPFFRVAHVFTESDWGMHEEKVGGQHGGAFTWTAPLKFHSDFAKLHFPRIEVDFDASARVLNLANDVFGDVLPAQQRTSWLWTLGLTSTLINLRGLEQIMYDMVDEPEFLHEMMAFLRDGTLAKIDFLEQNGLLGLNNDGFYIGSGGYGWSRELPQVDFDGHVRPMDLWGFAESQETVGVSPAMFEEFVFQYQLPIRRKIRHELVWLLRAAGCALANREAHSASAARRYVTVGEPAEDGGDRRPSLHLLTQAGAVGSGHAALRRGAHSQATARGDARAAPEPLPRRIRDDRQPHDRARSAARHALGADRARRGREIEF